MMFPDCRNKEIEVPGTSINRGFSDFGKKVDLRQRAG
jgi:hypothetical protein